MIHHEPRAEHIVTPNKPSLPSFVMSLPDAVACYDAAGVCQEVFIPAGFISMLSATDMIGMALEDDPTLPADAISKLRRCLQQTLETAQPQACRYDVYKEGRLYARDVRFSLLDGELAGHVLAVFRDITEMRQAELALEAQNRHLRTLVDAMPDGVIQLNADGVYLDVHIPKGFRPALPHDKMSFVGKTLEQVSPPEVATLLRHQLQETLRTGMLQRFEYSIATPQGETHRRTQFVKLSTNSVLGVISDITEQEHARQALITNQQHLQAILSAIPDMIGRCDREGTMLEIIHEGSFKRSRPGAAIVGKPLEALMSPKRAKYVRQHLTRAFETGSTQIVEHHFVIDGEDRYREIRYVPLDDGTFLTLFRDNTQQKLSEQALIANQQRTQAILSAMPDMIARCDRNGTMLEVIHEGTFKRSRSAASIVGKPLDDVTSAERADNVRQQLARALDTHSVQVAERHYTIDGLDYHREVRYVPLEDDTCLVLFRDITEAHNAKRTLHAALEHSQALLKEVHHRVRNNLQMLSSLLQLHANTLEDDNSKIALADNRRRIQTLALVHRVLYDNESYADIALDDFLQAALKLFAADMKRLGVTLELHADPVTTNLDDAIPFGLIVNELVKNALEHAFVDGSTKKPRLQVSLQKHHQQVTLTVIDNGLGLSNIAAQAHAKLGMMIVDLLTEQLRGTVNIASLVEADVVQGTQAVLEFQLS